MRSTLPATVENTGAIVVVPAVVPVCNPTCVVCAPVPKSASVLFAGMRNATVRPPVANCTAGSTGKFPAAVNVNVPVNAVG